jgi:hypothetical protein
MMRIQLLAHNEATGLSRKTQKSATIRGQRRLLKNAMKGIDIDLSKQGWLSHVRKA